MSSTFQLNLGGVICTIYLPPQVMLAPLLARYQAFLSSTVSEWQVVLTHDDSLTDAAPPWIHHDGAVTHFRVMSHAGWIDLEGRRAEVSTPSEERAHSALVRTLSFICMQELPRRQQGLLLHGAGVVIADKGYVFFGASGQGKSTVAQLAVGRGEVLTDENVLILLQADGPKLLSTPFWGLSTPAEQIQQICRREAPLHALYSLIHAPDFSLTPLSPARAVMELLTSEKVATERTSSANAWLAMAERVTAAIPLYQLRFRPTTELWEFLARQQAREAEG